MRLIPQPSVMSAMVIFESGRARSRLFSDSARALFVFCGMLDSPFLRLH